jgi:hypothetical protein
VRAAYGMPARDEMTALERDELARLLLSGTKEYDLECPEYKEWKRQHSPDA